MLSNQYAYLNQPTSHQNQPPPHSIELTQTITTSMTTTTMKSTTTRKTTTTANPTKPKRRRKKKRYQLVGYHQLAPNLLIDGILPPDDNSNFRKTQG